MPESLPNTIAQLRDLLLAKEFTPAQALTWQHERIQLEAQGDTAIVECLDLDGLLNAKSEPAPDPELKPLLGVGLAHKDIFNLNGRAPGLGMGPGQSAPGLELAHPLDCLHQNGASQLAALHMAPLAFGATSSNPYLGACINPLNAQAIVGGSSSGSAVAVAKGWVYASLGTDTAGSVRIPAASCGLVGLKTSHGLVSTQGCAPLAPDLDSVGVLARNFSDAKAVLLGSLSPAIVKQLLAKTSTHVGQSPRVGCYLPARLDAEVSHALLTFTKTFAHVRITPELSQFQALSQRAEMLMLSQMAQTHAREVSSKPAPFNKSDRYPSTLPLALAESVLAGLAMPPSWGKEVQALRLKSLQDFVSEVFADVDFLILPALATALPFVEEVEPGTPGFEAQKLLGLHRYMGFVNYLGLPALVAPVAIDERGLPIGVQVLARPDQDVGLLDWAHHHWSQVLGWPGALSCAQPGFVGRSLSPVFS